ncbi:hypothetical protein [Geomicrobium sp. JCM 19039]|uniref:hypothetical protein n=1 Tax=Geomicrobium sp. JCM 19039 TaxID=1460636 RepID=UPI0027D8C4C3|nr:hypothetical protein [Geomicrobium sp. JCM 19039]
MGKEKVFMFAVRHECGESEEGEYMEAVEIVGFALVVISIVLIIGKWIRLKVPVLQRLFLPSSIIGGFFALLFGPEVLGRIITQ